MPIEISVSQPGLTIGQGYTFMVTDLAGEISAVAKRGCSPRTRVSLATTPYSPMACAGRGSPRASLLISLPGCFSPIPPFPPRTVRSPKGASLSCSIARSAMGCTRTSI